MRIYRAYRYELDPNNSQRTLLHKHAGVARFTYNWGLERRISLYKENQGKERFTNAGHVKKELELSERVYVCERCGLEIDRDLNAAKNLVAASWTETQNACGEDVRLDSEQTSLNQEPNFS